MGCAIIPLVESASPSFHLASFFPHVSSRNGIGLDATPPSATNSVVPVDLKDVRIAKKKVVEGLNYQRAFCYKNIRVDIGNVHMISINCVCHLCQALEIYSGGKLATKYSCYSISKRDLDITAIFQLKLIRYDETVMHATNHTSKKFTKFFMHDQNLHIGLTISYFYERHLKI